MKDRAMNRPVIICPYCHGDCPADARFCIECSAALQQAAMHTTHRLFALPDPSANVPLRPAYATSTSERIRLSFIGTILSGLLVLIATLANRTPQFDSVAALILTIGVVQFVRGTMRGQIIAGLRAAVIGVALMLAMLTPWVLTICIVAGTLLVALHLVDDHRIPGHCRP
jgi:hypothetical protein